MIKMRYCTMGYLPPLHALEEFWQQPLIHIQLHREEEHPKYARYVTRM